MDFYFPGEILGLRPPNDFQKIGAKIRKGLPISCLNRFQKLSGASDGEARHILWMTEKELLARKRKGSLSSRESDRLFSAAEFLCSVFCFSRKGRISEDVIRFLHRPIAADLPVPLIRLMGTEAGLDLADAVLSGTYRQDYLRKFLPKKLKNKKRCPSPRVTRYADPLYIIGMSRKKDMDREIRKGFPSKAYDTLLEKTRIARRKVNRILWLSPKALAEQKNAGRLSPDASNRLYRLSWIYFLLMDWTDNDPAEGIQWLNHNEYHLLGKTPYEVLADAPGSAAVDNILWHITEGFPSGL